MSVEALCSIREGTAPKTDPFEDGMVLRYQRRYAPGGKKYSFVAVRANDRWYVTGRGPSTGYGFADLTRILSGEGISDIEVAIEWTPVDYTPTVRTKMTAEKDLRHEKACRYSGMTYREIPASDDLCGCPGGGYEMAGKGFDESVHG